MTWPRRKRRYRGPRFLLRPALLAVLASTYSSAVLAAAFLPGQTPIAVDTESGSAERLGDTYRLTVAPFRTWGLMALDARYRDFASGQRSTGEVFSGTVNAATYIWQPWFVQVAGSLGLVAGVDRSTDIGSTTNVGGIGSLNVTVFPVSRFPSNFYAEVNDSRASGQITDVDYRSHRMRLSQSYMPQLGNERYYGSYEYSRLNTINSGLDVATGTPAAEDELQVLRLGASRSWQSQSLEGDVNVSRNQREEGDLTQETKLDFANIYHLFRPDPNFTLNSGLSYTKTAVNAARPLTLGITLPSTRTSSDFTQLLSYATWRPPAGTWGSGPNDLLVTGTFRAFEFGNATDEAETNTRGATGQVGLTYSLSPQTQLFSTTQVGYFTGDIEASSVVAQSVGVNYSAQPIPLGKLIYTWTAGVTGTAGTVSGGPNDGSDFLAQTNFSHNLSRPVDLGAPGTLVMSIGQGVAYARGTETDSQGVLTTTLTSFWNSPATNGTQAFAGLTVADARRYGDFPGYFQLVNLQANLQIRTSRWSSFSAGLTFQANRSKEERDDLSRPFDPFLDAVEGEWQTSYGAQATYNHARAFGVPRLLYTALLQASSYDFDNRATGNVDAPLFRADWLFENRLEYRIGRLMLLGTVRWADVQNRGTNFSVFVRAQRSFGAL
jgi:hypothetical protein